MQHTHLFRREYIIQLPFKQSPLHRFSFCNYKPMMHCKCAIFISIPGQPKAQPLEFNLLKDLPWFCAVESMLWRDCWYLGVTFSDHCANLWHQTQAPGINHEVEVRMQNCQIQFAVLCKNEISWGNNSTLKNQLARGWTAIDCGMVCVPLSRAFVFQVIAILTMKRQHCLLSLSQRAFRPMSRPC